MNKIAELIYGATNTTALRIIVANYESFEFRVPKKGETILLPASLEIEPAYTDYAGIAIHDPWDGVRLVLGQWKKPTPTPESQYGSRLSAAQAIAATYTTSEFGPVTAEGQFFVSILSDNCVLQAITPSDRGIWRYLVSGKLKPEPILTAYRILEYQGTAKQLGLTNHYDYVPSRLVSGATVRELSSSIQSDSDTYLNGILSRAALAAHRNLGGKALS